MRAARMSLALFIGLGLAGCGGNADEQYEVYLQLFKDQLAAQEEVADILATVKKPADMPAALEALKKSQPRRKQLAQKAQEMGRPPQATMDRIQETLQGRMQASVNRFLDVSRQVNGLPGGPEFFDSFKALD